MFKEKLEDIRYFLKYDIYRYRPFSWLSDIKYWFLYRTTKRFNIVNMKSTLKPAYYDIDTRMVHANFTLLSEYVEKEMDTVCWDSDPGHIHVKKEIDELYFWWKNVFPKYHDNDPLFAKDVECTSKFVKIEGSEYSQLQDVGTKEQVDKWKKACEDSNQYEIKMNMEIEENLIRLIRIRSWLWS